jgi:hypothetical protein
VCASTARSSKSAAPSRRPSTRSGTWSSRTATPASGPSPGSSRSAATAELPSGRQQADRKARVRKASGFFCSWPSVKLRRRGRPAGLRLLATAPPTTRPPAPVSPGPRPARPAGLTGQPATSAAFAVAVVRPRCSRQRRGLGASGAAAACT